MSRDFKVYSPIGVWLDKSAPAGMQRRIGGVISTDSRDREDETVLQNGLDFRQFIDHGWFNDNHSKETPGAVGYPSKVQFVRKGDTLPDGTIAKANGHWAEGHLLEGHPPADDLWSLAQSLEKTQGRRRLGFSIEGRILRRAGPDRKTIAAAEVRNVAITNCPVNTDTYMVSLAKSLKAAEEESLEDLVRGILREELDEKALTSVSGAALRVESLDRKIHDQIGKSVGSTSTLADAAQWVANHIPGITPMEIGRFLAITSLLKHGDLV